MPVVWQQKRPRMHVVSVGGGITSTYELLNAVIDKHGKKYVRPVICALANESPDMWRMVEGAEQRFGIRITRIAWNPNAPQKYLINPNPTKYPSVRDVAMHTKALPNIRMDACSRILKRETMQKYVLDNFAPGKTTIHVGFTRDEAGEGVRTDRTIAVSGKWRKLGYEVEYLLTEDEYHDPRTKIERCMEWAGFVPEVYTRPYASHLNCGGACVKAGLRQWVELLITDPETFAEWEQLERDFNEQNPRTDGKFDYYAIQRDQNEGNRPMLLSEIRERWHAGTLFKRKSIRKELNQLSLLELLPSAPACSWCDAAG